MLTDNIYVKGVSAQRLAPTQNLFRLTKANTTSDKDKSIVYIGSREVGDQLYEGVTERVSVLEFYETLPKPGSLVHFVLNERSADEARIDGRFGDIGRVRNRLRTLSTAFEVKKDTNGDAVIALDDPEQLVGLTGRIESIHIGNLETTLNTTKEKTLADTLNALIADRKTEAQKAQPDVVKIKMFTENIITKSNELDQLRKENGQFNFGNFKATKSYSSVVLADIRISSDNVTGVVKNVLFADVAVLNPYANDKESTVLFRDDQYREYSASVYQANHDDTIRITRGNETIKVNKESLLPRFRDTTDVMYFSNGKYSRGEVAGFRNGSYEIMDEDGTSKQINPDDVQALELRTSEALGLSLIHI